MSSSTLDFPDISRVYARFTALTARSSYLCGMFVLYAALDSDGVAVAMASNIAGAASLGIEPEVERAKAALRTGACDFVVNNLDEALRILKNEIRRRRGVSVVLIAERDAAIGEIIERGVQPDVLEFPAPELETRGARVLEAGNSDARIPVRWSVERDDTRWLSEVDKLAAASLEQKDARLRWIESAPRYLGRTVAGQRYLKMSDAEANAFGASVRNAQESGVIPIAVSVSRGNSEQRK